MTKTIVVLFFALLIFLALAILQVLPESIQAPFNETAGKLLPAKKQFEKKKEAYNAMAEEASEP